MTKLSENRSTMLAPKYELLLIYFESCNNARVPKGEDLEFRKIKSSTYTIFSRIVSSDNLVDERAKSAIYSYLGIAASIFVPI